MAGFEICAVVHYCDTPWGVCRTTVPTVGGRVEIGAGTRQRRATLRVVMGQGDDSEGEGEKVTATYID